jgi:hypothetical protein
LKKKFGTAGTPKMQLPSPKWEIRGEQIKKVATGKHATIFYDLC